MLDCLVIGGGPAGLLAAKKALFLRTCTKAVSLFLNDEGTVNEQRRTKLNEENVRIVEKVQTVQLSAGSTISILTERGRGMNWTLSIPLLVTRSGLTLPGLWEPHAPRVEISLLMITSERQSRAFTREVTL
jgi:hypothetical protein